MQFDAVKHLANALDHAAAAAAEPVDIAVAVRELQTARTEALLSIAASLANIHRRMPAKNSGDVGMTTSAEVPADA